jgi:hypothetical protein
LNVLINRAALKPLEYKSPQEAIGKAFSQKAQSGAIFCSTIVGVLEDFEICTYRSARCGSMVQKCWR